MAKSGGALPNPLKKKGGRASNASLTPTGKIQMLPIICCTVCIFLCSSCGKSSLQIKDSRTPNAAPFWCYLRNAHVPCQVANLHRQTLTQVVVDKLSWEGRLLMLPAPVQAGTGIRCVHRENVCTDPHQFCLSHQLPDGWSTGGQRSW